MPPQSQCTFPLLNNFESAMTLDLYLLPLIKNIYAENTNVEIPWCSHPYEFPFKRSKTRSGQQSLLLDNGSPNFLLVRQMLQLMTSEIIHHQRQELNLIQEILMTKGTDLLRSNQYQIHQLFFIQFGNFFYTDQHCLQFSIGLLHQERSLINKDSFLEY